MSSTLPVKKRQRASPVARQAPKRLRVLPPTEHGHARFLASTRNTVEKEEGKLRERGYAAALLASDAQPEVTPSPTSTLPCASNGSDTPCSDAATGSVVTATPTQLLAGFAAIAEAGEDEARERRAEWLEDVSDEDVSRALVRVLEGQLERGMASGEARTAEDVEEELRCFFSAGAQSFSLQSYVERIVENVQSRAVLVTCLVYMDRLREAHADMALAEGNLHRVFSTAVLLAYKFLESDEPCSQEFFRAIGGIPSLVELNGLEAEFLVMLDWKLFVDHKVYDGYYRVLTQAMYF